MPVHKATYWQWVQHLWTEIVPIQAWEVLAKHTSRPCFAKCVSDFLLRCIPQAQITTVPLESQLVDLGSSGHALVVVPALCADSFSPAETKLLNPVEKGLQSFLLGKKKKAVGSLNRYITIKRGWKRIKGFTEWTCHEMSRRQHNRMK